jgi:GNAT superfamily N-acetyltransferase
VSPKARGQGLGQALLAKAEGLARRRGSRLIHLNTYSFQAPQFYERHGYRRFGSLSGSPKGARRHFYVKRLERA